MNAKPGCRLARRGRKARRRIKRSYPRMVITSFGYKYGLPPAADVILDLRFLPNPFYISELRSLDGRHSKVREYILRQPVTRQTLPYLIHYLKVRQQNWRRTGQAIGHVAVGCTGGRHRSVVIANELKQHLPGPVVTIHRDLASS